MKKVLIIAYDFPPARTSGVYRPLRFARYLPEYGWQPVILTVKNYPKETLEESLLGKLSPDITIYRAYSLELKRFENWVFNKFFKERAQQSSINNVTNHKEIRKRKIITPLIKRCIFSPLSRFAHNFIYTPDDKIGWVPLAVYEGVKAIKREGIDLIFSTSPPETNHIVGLWLKRLTHKPWIADFRDPWTTNFSRANKSPLQLKHEKKLEHKVLSQAEGIVHIGNGLAQITREVFADISPDKYHVITNGFDESDYEGLNVEEIYNRNKTTYLNLVNIGTLYETSGFEYFLKALQRVLRDQNISCNLRVSIVGPLYSSWREILSKPPFKNNVDLLGFKPHQETIRLMMAADVLLLMPAGGNELMRDKIITGKVFELMRSGRPILLIGWKGEASQIIQKSGLSKFVPCGDIDLIEKSILEYYNRKFNGELNEIPNWDYIKQFDVRTLTGKLAEQFISVYEKYDS